MIHVPTMWTSCALAIVSLVFLTSSPSSFVGAVRVLGGRRGRASSPLEVRVERPVGLLTVAEPGMIDLREEPEALHEALQKSLKAINLERSLICPQRFQPAEDSAKDETDQTVFCCSAAMRKTHEDGTEHVTLRFRMGTVPFEVKLADGEMLAIEPPPCGGGSDGIGGPAEDGNVPASANSPAVEEAAAAVESTLQQQCGDEDARLAKIKKVHWARLHLVEGLDVKLVVELENGAFHRFRIVLGIAGKVTWFAGPHHTADDPCGALRITTLSDSDMQELQVVTRFGTVPTGVVSGGHIEAFDMSVPRPSLMELDRMAQLSIPADYRAEYSLEKKYKSCFPEDGDVVRSQGTCGSCWVFAALGALGDRHCIANPDSMIDVEDGYRHTLSAQQVLSCFPKKDGCDGGHALSVYQPLARENKKMSYSKKYPYAVRCYEDTNGVTEDWGFFECSKYSKISDEDPSKPCACVARLKRPSKMPTCDTQAGGEFSIKDYHAIPKVGEYKRAWGTERYTTPEVNTLIMSALYEGGSLYVAFRVYDDFGTTLRRSPRRVYRHGPEEEENTLSKGKGGFTGRHAVVMVGWGTDAEVPQPYIQYAPSEVPFWRLRNSWGLKWAEKGHYKHFRGSDDCGIESSIIYPEVEVVEKYHSLEFTEAIPTVYVEETRRGAFTSLGFGDVHDTWVMEITCSGKCKAVYAILPDVNASAVTENAKNRRGGPKCCCDENNYFPQKKCKWVPDAHLEKVGWLPAVNKILGGDPTFYVSGDRQCSTYNFGRGLAATTEARGDSPSCAEELYGQSVTNGFQLTVKNVEPKKLRLELDITSYPQLRRRHKLLVLAKLDGGGTAEIEQLYDVRISRYEAYARKLFQLNSVEHEIRRVAEPYEERSLFGTTTWSTINKYVLYVTARCSGPCSGVAHFSDLDAKYHPQGKQILDLTLQQSSDPKVLTWTAAALNYPAGETRVMVRVAPSDGLAQNLTTPSRFAPEKDVEEVQRDFTVDIPKVGERQGEDWIPFQIMRVVTEVKTEQGFNFFARPKVYQMIIVECSGPCLMKRLHLGPTQVEVQRLTSKTNEAVVAFPLLSKGDTVSAMLEMEAKGRKGEDSVKIELQLGGSQKWTVTARRQVIVAL